MEWINLFGPGNEPDMEQITDYTQTPLWAELYKYLEKQYNVKPLIEYSKCSAKPGWNVKYKKSGRALCTMYPDPGYFTCMVSIGSKEAMEAELILLDSTAYIKELYERTTVFNGSRWLMIEVRNEQILQDVKELIGTRVKKKQLRI